MTVLILRPDGAAAGGSAVTAEFSVMARGRVAGLTPGERYQPISRLAVSVSAETELYCQGPSRTVAVSGRVSQKTTF